MNRKARIITIMLLVAFVFSVIGVNAVAADSPVIPVSNTDEGEKTGTGTSPQGGDARHTGFYIIIMFLSAGVLARFANKRGAGGR